MKHFGILMRQSGNIVLFSQNLHLTQQNLGLCWPKSSSISVQRITQQFNNAQAASFKMIRHLICPANLCQSQSRHCAPAKLIFNSVNMKDFLPVETVGGS